MNIYSNGIDIKIDFDECVFLFLRTFKGIRREKTGLLIAKIVITVLVVIIIAEISKRSNPFLGGMLLGLPLGIGLSVYFITYSEGVSFMVDSIPWGIAGLIPSMLFCLFYLAGGRIFKFKSRLLSMMISSALGLSAFFITGFLLSLIHLSYIVAAAIFFAAYFVIIVIIRAIRIEKTESADKDKASTLIIFIIRGLISALIIVAITGAASVTGNRWAGILSAFPSTTYSLLLVLHFESGNSFYPSVISGFSYGVSTLAVFYMLCYAFLPLLGLNFGFIAAYVICIAYLIGVKAISGRINKGNLPYLEKT